MNGLYAPESYLLASEQEKSDVCNGCGAKGIGGWFVPDTIWGLSIKESCNIHDWMYYEGEDIEEKEEADRVFLNNMLRTIKTGSKWLSGLRKSRAKKYYEAVVHFGGPAYWDGKN